MSRRASGCGVKSLGNKARNISISTRDRLLTRLRTGDTILTWPPRDGWCVSAMPQSDWRSNTMTAVRAILFPVDFSKAALAMVPYVQEMAQRFGAQVTVLHAFDLVPDYVMAPRFATTFEFPPTPIPYTPAFEELRNERQRRVEKFSSEHFASVNHIARIEDGDPATVIERVARSENVDLIMLASKGLGRFRRLLMGSVAAKVLHDIACPIFTSAHEPDPARPPAAGYRSIACAVDLNREADDVLKAAGFLADAYGASACLVHVLSTPAREDEARGAESFLQKLRRAMKQKNAGVTIRVLEADIAEGIRKAAIEEQADLIVVGRGREGVSRMWSHLYTSFANRPARSSASERSLTFRKTKGSKK